MRDDIWVEEEDEGRRPRSVLTILAIAAIPWAVVVAIIVLPLGDDRGQAPSDVGSDGQAGTTAGTAGQPPPGPRDPAPDTPGRGDDEPAPTPDEPPDAAGPDPTSAPEPASPTEPPTARDDADRARPQLAEPQDTPVSSDDRALAAAATVVARAWATGVAPELRLPGVPSGEPGRYAEHLAVEAIDRPEPHLAVVTVLVVLLEEARDGLTVQLRRVAVPLAVDQLGTRPAGTPWWLPTPDLAVAELPSEEQTDPDLLVAAAHALTDAGYGDVEVVALHRTPHWPWLAEVRATAPGGDHLDGTVWLRAVDGSFAVAGTAHDRISAGDGG